MSTENLGGSNRAAAPAVLTHSHAGGTVHNHERYAMAEKSSEWAEHSHDFRTDWSEAWGSCDSCGADAFASAECAGPVHADPRIDAHHLPDALAPFARRTQAAKIAGVRF